MSSGDATDFSPAWIAELARRVDLFAKGEAGPDEDWRVVLARIRERAAGDRPG